MLNNNKNRMIRVISLVVILVMATCALAFADEVDFMTVTSPIVSLLNTLREPFIAVVVAVGGLYCIVLGIKYAQAEEPQERQKAKQHLKNAVIGYVLIFVLTVALNRLTPQLETWVSNNLVNKK